MSTAAGGEPPQFHFSTEMFPARQRVAAWREIFGRTVVNLDIEPVEKPETVLWVDPVHRDPGEVS